MSTIFETYGTIRPDGTLDLEQKLAPMPGRVKVRVESAESESDADLAKRFAKLAATWKEETRFESRAGKMAEHPAYREIVAMGKMAVPLILADLEKEADHWFMALREITGASPVPKEDRGCMDKKAAAWIAWGREKGYRWANAV